MKSLQNQITNPKTIARYERAAKEHNEKEQAAQELGYKPRTALKAGKNSVYSYEGSVYGFDTKSEARDHFLDQHQSDNSLNP